jgi:small nuclear ribonucleoprotein (snRNP)-like protein
VFDLYDIEEFLNSKNIILKNTTELIKTYKSTDLKNAIHSNNEIMLHCDEVVLMDKLFAKDVYNELGL